DRLTILQIKSERIADQAKRQHVLAELEALGRAIQGPWPGGIQELTDQLREVNGRLWDVEDALRVLEARQEFGAEFVEMARSVYGLNDERAALKRAVSQRCGSRWLEQKQYGSRG